MGLQEPGWTPALVIEALAQAYRGAAPPGSIFLIWTERCLERGSLEQRALILRARAKGLAGRVPSVSQTCRSKTAWALSRKALYRWSNIGARRMAACLNAHRFPPFIPGDSDLDDAA